MYFKGIFYLFAFQFRFLILMELDLQIFSFVITASFLYRSERAIIFSFSQESHFSFWTSISSSFKTVGRQRCDFLASGVDSWTSSLQSWFEQPSETPSCQEEKQQRGGISNKRSNARVHSIGNVEIE